MVTQALFSAMGSATFWALYETVEFGQAAGAGFAWDFNKTAVPPESLNTRQPCNSRGVWRTAKTKFCQQ